MLIAYEVSHAKNNLKHVHMELTTNSHQDSISKLGTLFIFHSQDNPIIKWMKLDASIGKCGLYFEILTMLFMYSIVQSSCELVPSRYQNQGQNQYLHKLYELKEFL